jgi:anti-sigma-K factor RskA
MSPEEREELASLYVLGALEGDELAAFERELAAHPELAVLVTELERASTILATSVPQHKAPEVVRQSVFQHIRSQIRPVEPERRPVFTFSWIPWAIAAGLAVCSALLWNERSQLSATVASVEHENETLQGRIASLDAERVRLESSVTAPEKERDDLQVRVASLEKERDDLQVRVASLEKERDDLQVRVASLEKRDPLREILPVTLAAQRGAPPAGKVMALWDPYRRAGALHAKLPEPAPDKDYQLWIITPESKQPVSAGVIPALSDCQTFTAAQPINQVAALAISIEPKGGSTAPRGPVIFVGKL